MYELRGYGVEDFIEACRTLKEKDPKAYENFYSIIRSQPIHVSESDLIYLQSEPAPLKPMYEVTIEEPKYVDCEEPKYVDCEECGFKHPPDGCWDS